MLDLLKSAVDALREGIISPITFATLIALGVIAWLARKGGEKALQSIAGLLKEGERLRATLHSELNESNARAAALQAARDDAVEEQTKSRILAVQLQGQLDLANARIRDLQDELLVAQEQLQRARARLLST